MSALFFISYSFVLLVLVIFALHRYFLLYLYYKNHHRPHCNNPASKALPKVTVQLPVYNESYVVERLIRSVCALDYPKEFLQIQILDDSDDITRNIVDKLIYEANKNGFDIEHIMRDSRSGFKAGALGQVLKMAKGEFIAIFDADFIPHPQFLKKTIFYFNNPSVGMVQTSWRHTNRNESLLTKIQAMFIESHFAIEQVVRYHAGRFFNFNGTSGVWRKKCIVESGGWQVDTLAEDLDLSYRAQLKGWKFIFLEKSLSDAELPVSMVSFKQQQQRWIKGTLQVAKKLLPKILKSSYPFRIKIEALLHLTNYCAYILSLIASFFILPSIFLRMNTHYQISIFIDLSLFVILTAPVFIFHICAQSAIGNKKSFANILYIPLLICISIGLSVSNSIAVFEALTKKTFIFYRTKKFGDDSRNIRYVWKKKPFAAKNITPYLEILLGMYFSHNILYAIKYQLYPSLIVLSLFVFGFLYVGIFSFFDCPEELQSSFS